MLLSLGGWYLKMKTIFPLSRKPLRFFQLVYNIIQEQSLHDPAWARNLHRAGNHLLYNMLHALSREKIHVQGTKCNPIADTAVKPDISTR